MLEVIEDPIYLTEPELISKSFQPDPNPMSPVGPPCVSGYEGVPEGKVPRYLPGTNPSIDELPKFYGIPREATLGGAETMYQDYRKNRESTGRTGKGLTHPINETRPELMVEAAGVELLWSAFHQWPYFRSLNADRSAQIDTSIYVVGTAQQARTEALLTG